MSAWVGVDACRRAWWVHCSCWSCQLISQTNRLTSSRTTPASRAPTRPSSLPRHSSSSTNPRIPRLPRYNSYDLRWADRGVPIRVGAAYPGWSMCHVVSSGMCTSRVVVVEWTRICNAVSTSLGKFGLHMKRLKCLFHMYIHRSAEYSDRYDHIRS